jgi:hypothetical protein
MGDEMNGFTEEELDAIVSMVEDALPGLDYIKRRTGINVSRARLQYTAIASKATDAIVAMKREEEAKAKATKESVKK